MEAFATEALARSFVQQHMLKWLYQQVDWSTNAYPDEEPDGDFWRQNKAGDWRLADPSTLSEAIEPYLKGEYVPVKMGWEVTECKVHTQVQKPAEEEWE